MLETERVNAIFADARLLYDDCGCATLPASPSCTGPVSTTALPSRKTT